MKHLIFTFFFLLFRNGIIYYICSKYIFYTEQIVHGTEGHMAVYGSVRHQTNIIWTEAFEVPEVHILFFGDGPVHILPYDPQCHELLAKLYFYLK